MCLQHAFSFVQVMQLPGSTATDLIDMTVPKKQTEANCCPKASAVKTLLVITPEARNSSRNIFSIKQLKITYDQMEVWFLQIILFGLRHRKSSAIFFNFLRCSHFVSVSLFPPPLLFPSLMYTDFLAAHTGALGYLTKCSCSTLRKHSQWLQVGSKQLWSSFPFLIQHMERADSFC